jgi:hypothetical protein
MSSIIFRNSTLNTDMVIGYFLGTSAMSLPRTYVSDVADTQQPRMRHQTVSPPKLRSPIRRRVDTRADGVRAKLLADREKAKHEEYVRILECGKGGRVDLGDPGEEATRFMEVHKSARTMADLPHLIDNVDEVFSD